MTTYRIIQSGASTSFPDPHPLIAQAHPQGDGWIVVGQGAGYAYRAQRVAADAAPFVAIELGNECLGVHTGESAGEEGSNVVGFARFRLGKADPTALVEIVRQPGTRPEALAAARHAFESAGLTVAVCGDFPGRIVNRLIRPYFNATLRRLDERLASAADLDKTLCLGLGYPEGPISLLERTGLAEHHDVTEALYVALGQEAYWPARRSQVAKQRSEQ